MSQNQKVARPTDDENAVGRKRMAAYIAELLYEMEGLARHDGMDELEGYLREAREVAEIFARR